LIEFGNGWPRQTTVLVLNPLACGTAGSPRVRAISLGSGGVAAGDGRRSSYSRTPRGSSAIENGRSLGDGIAGIATDPRPDAR